MFVASTGGMPGSHAKLTTSVFWPAFGVAWAGWAVFRAGFRRSRALTVALMATFALSVASGVQPIPRQAFPAARAVFLAPFTVPAVGWGLAHGGELHVQGDMLVVSGMSGGHGSLPALTVGQVILTSKEKLDPALLSHEAVHGDQWAFLGALTPPLYFLSDVIGGGPANNIFEVSAGLEAGGYIPWTPRPDSSAPPIRSYPLVRLTEVHPVESSPQ